MHCIFLQNVWRELSHAAWCPYVMCMHFTPFCSIQLLYENGSDGFIRKWWRHYCSACYISYHSTPCAYKYKYAKRLANRRHRDIFRFVSFLPIIPLNLREKLQKDMYVDRWEERGMEWIWGPSTSEGRRSNSPSWSPHPIGEEITRYDKEANCSI